MARYVITEAMADLYGQVVLARAKWREADGDRAEIRTALIAAHAGGLRKEHLVAAVGEDLRWYVDHVLPDH